MDLDKLNAEREEASIDKADLFDFYHKNWDKLVKEILAARPQGGIWRETGRYRYSYETKDVRLDVMMDDPDSPGGDWRWQGSRIGSEETQGFSGYASRIDATQAAITWSSKGFKA